MNLSAHARRDGFLAAIAKRRVLMGIVNVTPDSFSDGGRFATPQNALAQARHLTDEGADIVDIGGESTRPGHTPIDAEEEWRRLAETLPAIVAAIDAPVSIDTSKASIAARALKAGACVVNDVWGLQRDPAMAGTIADAGAAVVIMHNREMQYPALDIVADIDAFFDRSLTIAARSGIPDRHIILDPGIGFGKTRDQNIAALRATSAFARRGFPLLIGVSRKSLWGALLGADVADRLAPTLAANLATAMAGARIFRVHDVREHRAALAVLDALGV